MVERALRTRRALELRANGLSYERIGRVMGLGTMTVHAMVLDGIRAAVDPELRKRERLLDEQRLDLLQSSIYHRAVKGEVGAIEQVLQIMTLRSRYYGL